MWTDHNWQKTIIAGRASQRGFQLFMTCQTRVRVKGKREHTEHMLRLSYASQINGAEANETGLEHRPVTDGQRVAGIYWRSVILVSGRYAMLDDGMGFILVPWRPVIEQRLRQQIAATVSGSGVSW